MRNRPMHIGASLIAALLALTAVPAHAERDTVSGAPIKPDKHTKTPSPITDRFAVSGIFFNPAVTTILRVDQHSPSTGVPGPAGTVVNSEKDLGLDSRIPQGHIEILFRLKERNRLRVSYFETDRRADHPISRQINFGDETFQANDRVTSSVDWRQFLVNYTYSIFRNDRFEAAIGVGVHFVEAQARGEVKAKELRQEISGSGAFPTFPLDLTWRITKRLSVVARGEYFHVSINSFEGSIAEYHGDAQWRLFRNFTLGAGYTIMRSSLDIQDANFPGAFRLNVRGPEAFFKVSF